MAGAVLGVWLAVMVTLAAMRAECAVALWLETDDAKINDAEYRAVMERVRHLLAAEDA